MRWLYLRAPLTIVSAWFVLLALALALSAASPAHAASEGSCDGPVAGRHVYDCAGILTAAEVADIEAHAAAVEQAGAPTIVYLQVRDATVDETIQDASDLMNSWDVESSPGARDGFVMLLNLQPGNERHGQVALFAGEKHFQGNLPQRELQRISSEVMAPLLKEEQTAAGIIAGLDAVAHDLRFGPPPDVAALFIRIPANILAILLAAAVCLLYLKVGRRKFSVRSGEPTTTPPGDLTPDLAGALVRGRVDSQLIQATILYMAHEGLLVIEPYESGVALRLRHHKRALPGIQQPLWEVLSSAANSERLVLPSALRQQESLWRQVMEALRQDLLNRQWYDPRAGARRRWLGWASALLLVLCLADFIATLVVGEAWGFLGTMLLLVFGFAALIWAVRVPRTTAQGEAVAAPWRAYRVGLEQAAQQPETVVDVDVALPYALALGAEQFLSNFIRLGDRGNAPAWLLPSYESLALGFGFAHYWYAFRQQMQPFPVQSSSGGHYGGYHGGFSGGGGGFSGGGGAGSSF